MTVASFPAPNPAPERAFNGAEDGVTPKSILAPISGGSGSEAALETALTTAGSFHAYVEVLHARVDANDAVPVMAEGLSGAVVDQLIDSLENQAAERAEAARQLYERRCLGDGQEGLASGVTTAFKEVIGRPYDCVARAGRLFDLLVIERPDETENGGYPLVLEAALFESGRAVLLAPRVAPATLGRSLAVAWNDTGEAAAALGAALPFLARAEAVTLMTVRDHCDADPAEVAQYLARHDVTAKIRSLEPDHRPVGEQILDEAAADGADMLVMGAYGHSRLREFVLGGVTRSIVQEAGLPVLMAR